MGIGEFTGNKSIHWSVTHEDAKEAVALSARKRAGHPKEKHAINVDEATARGRDPVAPADAGKRKGHRGRYRVRLRFERAQGMVAVGRDEDKQRRFDVHQALDDGKAVETRHLDVEENEVGLVGLDGPDRLPPIGRGRDHFDIVVGFKPQLKSLGRKRLVVDEHGADGHESLSPVS